MKDIDKKYFGIFDRILSHPAVLLMSKELGLDFVFYDNEHNSFDKIKLHDLLLLGNSIGLSSFVRVAELSRREIGQMLDNGASGIMVPMIESREEAELLVKYSKYPPIGGRGYSSGAHTGYGPSGGHKETMENKNKEVVTIAQIETKKGVENIEEILSVEGIDACILGPVDLSISLGVTDDVMNPIELEACSKVIRASKEHNKLVGIIGSNQILEHFKSELNYFISYNDLSMLRKGLIEAANTYKSFK